MRERETERERERKRERERERVRESIFISNHKQNFSCITARIKGLLHTCVLRIIVMDKIVEYV